MMWPSFWRAAALIRNLVHRKGVILGGVEPVPDFAIDRYLGTWYEIARLDHWFERGLTHVTAQYSMDEKGCLRVVNRGFDPLRKKWKEARGKALFVDSPRVGKLKVSFFGPFYGRYTIVALDHDRYAHALVCGPTRSYLWILARTTSLDQATLHALTARAKAIGFDPDGLVFVDHRNPECLPG